MTIPNKTIQGLIISLVGLEIIDVALLFAMFAQVPPHPPGWLGPFIVTMITIGAMSLLLIRWKNTIGLLTAILLLAMNSLAVGPQKYFLDPNGRQVIMIIVLGTILIISAAYFIFTVWQKKLFNEN